MDDFLIRQATHDDIPALLALYREFHEFHVRGVPDRLRIPDRYDDAAYHEQLSDLLADPSACLYLAVHAGVVVGLAEVYLRHDEPHPVTVTHTYGYLQSLIVTEALRGRGIGRRLVASAQRWARERGATEMRLMTWEFAAGPQAFYEGLGYLTLRRTLVVTLAEAQ